MYMVTFFNYIKAYTCTDSTIVPWKVHTYMYVCMYCMYSYDRVPERFDQSKEKTLISHHHHCREEQRS